MTRMSTSSPARNPLAPVRPLVSAKRAAEAERWFGAGVHVAQRELAAWRAAERARGARYPLSRFALRPLAVRAAGWLAVVGVLPWQVTFAGAAIAGVGASLLALGVIGGSVAALFVLTAWFCDRTDGPLARLRGGGSASGAWLDGQVDEAVDVAWHLAIAAALSADGWRWAWPTAALFVAGKYLLVHGRLLEQELAQPRAAWAPATREDAEPGCVQETMTRAWLGKLYYWPGDADVRVHALAAALALGLARWELTLVALYYNARWLARSGWVGRRLTGDAS